MIDPSQGPLSDKTQQEQETDIRAPGGIRTAVSARERQQTYALDRVALGSANVKLS